MGEDFRPIVTIGKWELWPWTDGWWLLLTRRRVIKWEWKR